MREEQVIQLLKEGNKNFTPLFLLPPISGESTFTYRKLCDFLKIPSRVFAINALTLSNPLLIRRSIPLTAQFYLSLIRRIQPEGPLNLMGWSSGGIIAYEMASYLEEKNEAIDFLGIIDEIAPHLQHSLDLNNHAQELLELISFFQDKDYFEFKLNLDGLSILSKEEQIRTVFAHIPPNLSITNMLEHIKHFLLNFLSYKPKKLNKTAITIFRTETTHNKVLRMTSIPDETFSLGWSKYSTLCFGVCELQSDHFSIMQSPQELAKKIDFCVRSSVTNNKSNEELEILKDLSQKLDKLLYSLDKFKTPSECEEFKEKIPRKIKKSIVSSSLIWGKSGNEFKETEKLSSHSEALIRAKL